MNLLFTPPSLDDLIRLLKAWRFWVLGALIGSALGAAVYSIAPPPYRAKATVNVDFNFEEAFPENTDRQDFYYLEREARKMEEIAWSDEVLSQLNAPIEELRSGKLILSQPAEAGWHFYAQDNDPQKAEELASAWANAFVDKVQAEIQAGNINEFVKLEVTQSADLPKERSVPLSNYLLAGASGFLFTAVFATLFIRRKDSNVS
jgi:capsular polysaccharide biosynthesis protein